MRLAVVDASVALSWVIPDEDASTTAVKLLLAYHGNQVRLLAPSLWEYEVANALKIGVTRRRFTPEEGQQALHALLTLGVAISDFGPVAERAWALAMEHGLTVYDAAYLALAEQRECEFYTGDRRLAEACEDIRLVRWVGEFE